MNLREKIEKEITNKVMTKLASEKVELNAVEDTMKKAAKIGGKILSLESDILSAASDIKKLSSDYTQYINQMKDFEKKAKDLGIDNVAKEANEAAKHYEDKIKKADKMLNNVKAAIKR
jgi:hypothetical protein